MEYIEMRKFLTENNKTHEEMEMMWNTCIEKGHKLIRQLDRCGSSWYDMGTHALSTLEREYNKIKGE